MTKVFLQIQIYTLVMNGGDINKLQLSSSTLKDNIININTNCPLSSANLGGRNAMKWSLSRQSVKGSSYSGNVVGTSGCIIPKYFSWSVDEYITISCSNPYALLPSTSMNIIAELLRFVALDFFCACITLPEFLSCSFDQNVLFSLRTSGNCCSNSCLSVESKALCSQV